VTHGRIDSKAIDSAPVDSTPGGFEKSSPGLSNLPRVDVLKKLAEQIGLVGTPSNLTALTDVLKLTRKKYNFATYEKCCEHLDQCYRNARKADSSDLRMKPYFFLVDQTFEIYARDHLPVPRPECEKCGDVRWLHLLPNMPSVNGRRIIPCEVCNPDGKQKPWGSV
jgi:hypothetical protein